MLADGFAATAARCRSRGSHPPRHNLRPTNAMFHFKSADVVLVGRRKILGTNYARSQKVSGPRPRSRTLTTVHEALLEDITYPTEIVGKRTRCKVDGSKQMKVLLPS